MLLVNACALDLAYKFLEIYSLRYCSIHFGFCRCFTFNLNNCRKDLQQDYRNRLQLLILRWCTCKYVKDSHDRTIQFRDHRCSIRMQGQKKGFQSFEITFVSLFEILLSFSFVIEAFLNRLLFKTRILQECIFLYLSLNTTKKHNFATSRCFMCLAEDDVLFHQSWCFTFS